MATVDEIVPAVHPRRHRTVVAVALAVGAATVYGAMAGWLVPQTNGPYPRQWGGTGPVHAVIHLANESPRSIEIVGMGDAPSGLSIVGYSAEPVETWGQDTPTVQRDVFPVRLSPGEGLDIAAIYRVEDCAAARRTQDLPTVDIRFPGWTGFWTHTKEVTMPSSTPWTSEMTQFACPD